jgi:predicted RNase H-like nuclease (RuvC/YqgF family)
VLTIEELICLISMSLAHKLGSSSGPVLSPAIAETAKTLLSQLFDENTQLKQENSQLQSEIQSLHNKYGQMESEYNNSHSIISDLEAKLAQAQDAAKAAAAAVAAFQTLNSASPSSPAMRASVAANNNISMNGRASGVSPVQQPAVPQPKAGGMSKAAARRASKMQATCIALYDYSAARAEEISFKTDELISVLAKDDSGWWTGVNQAGQQGLFPMNYVKANS